MPNIIPVNSIQLAEHCVFSDILHVAERYTYIDAINQADTRQVYTLSEFIAKAEYPAYLSCPTSRKSTTVIFSYWLARGWI